MSKSTSYFDGARMAYNDTADFAEALSKGGEGFAAHSIANGENPGDAAVVGIAAKIILETFAESIRQKIVVMDQMVEAAGHRVQ